MKRVFSYLYPFRYRMALGFFVKVLGTVAELLLPVVLTHILKTVVASEDLTQVLLWGALMLLFAGLACLFNIVANRMAATVGKRFSKALRRDLFYKTLTLDTAQTDAFTIPSLESRITTDTYHVHNFVMMIQRMGIRAPILLVGGVVITLLMDKALALVMIAVMPLIFVLVYTLSRLGIRLYGRVQTSVDSLVRVLREDYGGIRVIKALSKEKYEQDRFEIANQRLSKNEQSASFIMSSTHPIMNLLMNGGIAAVTALAAVRVAKDASDPETVVAFMQYFTLISMALMAVSRMFVMFSKCSASARRISEVLSTPAEIVKTEEATSTSDDFITVKNLSFSYAGKKRDLDNISISIPYGSSFGIIGGTGSGKSTLIKLLLRFYDADSGEILFRGKSIRSYTREEIAPFVGVAHQKDFLYAASVEENVRFGRNISREEVWEALTLAQAEDFVRALPDGLDTVLATGGTNLSGGQRQRLLIARAVAGTPPLLILDDASSALDYKTDAALRAALRKIGDKMTTVTVAQRASSVMSCDKILVLDDGRAVGYGTHAELLESCPIYREISDSQMGGALFE
ncbi:MAG: ABC transporter ATP-binding protein [Ruminococcaceae bacterium]|nr:ABC transporter ATP-binding protein [Oscillospiraceae bacterium]